jgi:hypothetical protein
VTSFAILFNRFLVFSQIRFASSTREDFVAVKVGGACGGFWYAAGAMLLLVMGLKFEKLEKEEGV